VAIACIYLIFLNWATFSESWVIHLPHAWNQVFWSHFDSSCITQSQWTSLKLFKNQWQVLTFIWYLGTERYLVRVEWYTFLIRDVGLMECIFVAFASLRVSEPHSTWLGQIFLVWDIVLGSTVYLISSNWVIFSESWVIHLPHLWNLIVWTHFHNSGITQSQWISLKLFKNQWQSLVFI
jgi:hypothetical protein